MAVRSTLNSLRKSAQRNPGEKGWTCYYCRKKGHLKWVCPQASKLPLAPGLQRNLVVKRLPSEVLAPGIRFSRQSGLKMPGSPHTSSCPNYTWGTPGINNWGVWGGWGANQSISFGHWGNFLYVHWSPCPAFLLIHYHNGTVRMSQTLLFQSSFKLQLGLCAVFSRVSDHARGSLTPSGRVILSKVQASVFFNMKPALSPPLIEQKVNP